MTTDQSKSTENKWSIMGIPGLDMKPGKKYRLRVLPRKSFLYDKTLQQEGSWNAKREKDLNAPFLVWQKVHYFKLRSGEGTMVVCPGMYHESHPEFCYACMRRASFYKSPHVVPRHLPYSQKKELRRKLIQEDHNKWMPNRHRYTSLVLVLPEEGTEPPDYEPTHEDVRIITYGWGIYSRLRTLFQKHPTFFSMGQGFPITLYREEGEDWQLFLDEEYPRSVALVGTLDSARRFFHDLPDLTDYVSRSYQLTNVEDGRLYTPHQQTQILGGTDPLSIREFNRDFFQKTHSQAFQEHEGKWMAEYHNRVFLRGETSDYRYNHFLVEQGLAEDVRDEVSGDLTTEVSSICTKTDTASRVDPTENPEAYYEAKPQPRKRRSRRRGR